MLRNTTCYIFVYVRTNFLCKSKYFCYFSSSELIQLSTEDRAERVEMTALRVGRKEGTPRSAPSLPGNQACPLPCQDPGSHSAAVSSFNYCNTALPRTQSIISSNARCIRCVAKCGAGCGFISFLTAEKMPPPPASLAAAGGRQLTSAFCVSTGQRIFSAAFLLKAPQPGWSLGKVRPIGGRREL
jgi:hypothetical protein